MNLWKHSSPREKQSTQRKRHHGYPDFYRFVHNAGRICRCSHFTVTPSPAGDGDDHDILITPLQSAFSGFGTATNAAALSG